MEDVGISIVVFIFQPILLVACLVAIWKVYVKAGQPGWKSLIPFYSMYILLKIIGRPGWWLLLYFVPVVNFVVLIINSIDLAKVFGRSTAFGVVALGLFPFVGYFILGFGKSTYTQPSTPTSPPQIPIPPQPVQQPPVPPITSAA